jgi:histidinol-phosphate aminotransferase
MVIKNKYFIYERKYLSKINRVRINEDRDLIKGICLNRNERVENYPKNFIEKIFKNNKKIQLGKYPDQSKIYFTLSKYLKLSNKNFLLSSGIDGSLKSIIEIFLKKNDKVAFVSPSYAMYDIYSKVFGLKPILINYNYNNFKLRSDEIYKAVKSGIKILFLPNPNQPIEDNLSFEQIKKICILCKKYKVLLVVDEAYYMFGSQSAVKLIKKFQNILILRTFSKSFGLPSIRLGYVLGDEKIISIMNSYRLSYESNLLTDTVAIYFLENRNLFKNYIKKVIEGRRYLKKELSKLKINFIGGKSNFLLLRFINKDVAKKIYYFLLAKKIYVKGNYAGELSNCLLLTCGPINIMKKVINVIKIDQKYS